MPFMSRVTFVLCTLPNLSSALSRRQPSYRRVLSLHIIMLSMLFRQAMRFLFRHCDCRGHCCRYCAACVSQ